MKELALMALIKLFHPGHFLVIAGTVLVTLGAVGAMGLPSSISRASVFNPPYWINWVHLGFGLVVLAIAMVGGRILQNTMTLAATIIGILLGLSGLLLGSYAADRYNMPELADPSEHLAHLTVGVLALWAWSNRELLS
jgi:hypothetical protein